MSSSSPVVMMFLSVLLFIAIVASTPALASDQVVGCGGFVRLNFNDASSTLPDYSTVSVSLVSPSGVVKDTTECSPNGYYYMPVYEQGSFVVRVKGPASWSFDKDEVPVVVTAATCNEGQDLNFDVSGFAVSGSVSVDNTAGRCASSDRVPGVLVSLASPTADIPTKEVASEVDGSYKFDNVLPGVYTLSASHSSWSIAAPSSTVVTVGWSGLVVDHVFKVAGYDVSGRVLTSDGEAVAGVSLLLFDNNGKSDGKVVKCGSGVVPKTAPVSPSDGRPASCHAESAADGSFVLSDVPCGKFTLRPHYYHAATSTRFDVVPAEIAVSVEGASSVALQQALRVTGFSASGRVVDGSGNNVADVSILVNDEETSKTTVGAEGSSNNNNYVLPGMSAGSYKISAIKEHYMFSSLAAQRIAPSDPVVPVIRAVAYDVCGTVSLGGVGTQVTRTVALTSASKGTATAKVGADGSFCLLEVFPGAYQATIEVSDEERKAGIRFTPEAQTIVVRDRPVLDVTFAQVVRTVSGKVKCIETPCDGAVTVSLRKSGNSQDKVTVSLENDGTTFHVPKVLPGIYEASVSRDGWCFEESTVSVTVGEDAKVAPVAFKQSAYTLSAIATHSGVTLQYALRTTKDDKSDSGSVTTDTAGASDLCVLKRHGVYDVTATGCFEFAKNAFEVTTTTASPIQLEVTKYRVSGEIEYKEGKKNHTQNHGISVRIVSSTGAESVVSTTGDGNKISYEFLASAGESVRVSPVVAGSDVLAYPRERVFVVPTDLTSCTAAVEGFVARTGRFIEGKISPPLSGVSITVTDPDADAAGPDAAAIATVETDKDGKYRVGPLYDDRTYEVNAERVGFDLRRASPGSNDFQMRRLGSLVVVVKATESDVEGSSQGAAALPGVLLSLSGAQSYRNNTPTQADGTLEFQDLWPGAYYLRPLLKEYVFEPKNVAIEIEEGTQAQSVIIARRVAYSVHGRAHFLNGDSSQLQSEEASKHVVLVQAVAEDGSETEETTADANGFYRLRGLMPGKTYNVGVRASGTVERAAPAQVTVGPQESAIDQKGVDFIVFERPSTFRLSGSVDVDIPESTGDTDVKLTVEIVDASKPSASPLDTIVIGRSLFFDFPHLPRRSAYIVRVASTLSSRLFDVTAPEESVRILADSDAQSVGLKYTAAVRVTHEELRQTPFFVLILLVIAAVMGFNHKEVLEFVQRVREGKTSSSGVSQDPDNFQFLPQHLQQQQRAAGKRVRGASQGLKKRKQK